MSVLLVAALPAANAQNTAATTSLIATFHILPGFEKEVKKALGTMQMASRKEPGCEQFAPYTQKDSPQTVVIYEVYSSDEAFHAHIASSHAKAFFEFVKGRIVNDKIETVFLTDLNGSK